MKSTQSFRGSRQILGKEIAQLVQIACICEVCAPKPGNVNRRHDFPDTCMEDFILSAIAIGPAFENAARVGVGQTIRDATSDTRRWVRTNTNLGMILLFAPLVKACANTSSIAGGETMRQRNLESYRQNLGAVLSSLTVEDARHAYAAIRLAQPGGIGCVTQSDIVEEPSITLLQAMALAQNRDAVANEYMTNYTITFETGLPALNEAIAKEADFSSAIVHAFLTILSSVPDTLIARKRGFRTARRVSKRACEVLDQGGVFTPRGRSGLEELDRELRDRNHTLNPGTTADLTAAAIFLTLLQNQHPQSKRKYLSRILFSDQATKELNHQKE
jgi:triphosphoribosyl-dephospho-CoA synthase